MQLLCTIFGAYFSPSTLSITESKSHSAWVIHLYNNTTALINHDSLRGMGVHVYTRGHAFTASKLCLAAESDI